jgi:hypothetical protein
MHERRDQEKPVAASCEPAADGATERRICDTVTNSTVQLVARALLKQGQRGGLGDSRRLRVAIRDRVFDIIHKTGEYDIAKLVVSMSSTVPEWVSRVLEGNLR